MTSPVRRGQVATMARTPTIPAAQLSRVLSAADVSGRTLRRYLSGASVLASTMRRLETALRGEGLGRLIETRASRVLAKAA